MNTNVPMYQRERGLRMYDGYGTGKGAITGQLHGRPGLQGSMGRRKSQLSLRRETRCEEEVPEVDSSEGTEPHGEEIPMQEEC